jgi:hypothetical protein
MHMTTFDLVARGEPRVVDTILRASMGEHFPSSQLGDTAFDLALGPMPLNRYMHVHAVGRWVPEAGGVRIVGHVELTQQTLVLYGGALVLFVLWALVMTVRAGNPLGLVGLLVGGGALAGGLARARARVLHGAADRLRRLMGEVEALARLQGGGDVEPQTHGRQF